MACVLIIVYDFDYGYYSFFVYLDPPVLYKH